MERADYVHMARLSEQDSADDSKAYRRSVAFFAALGYVWVIGCLLVAALILVWLGKSMLQGHFRVAYLWGLLGAGGLLWTSLRALWCKLDEPQGVRLTAADAPALFESIERIRKKIKGPPIHHVLLDADFNASISQRPRFGLFGGAVNYLTIGLPLLMALEKPRFLAVLAHEYGHLRGDHGRFAAWIYRTRLSWDKLSYGLRDDSGIAGAATRAFLDWYFPRFSAKTFALARQDEYEADRISAKLLGKDVAAAALMEIAIKGDWLEREFWADHWRTAGASALPVGPYTAMRALLGLAPPADFARDSLRKELRRISDIDDTHPVLRDRLEALHSPHNLPAWSRRAALDLLGESASSQWIAHFDKQWCRDNASGWKLHHALLGRTLSRVAELVASERHNNADQMLELAGLERRLDPRANVRGRYERALEIAPGHSGALRGLMVCLPDAQQQEQLSLAAQIFEHDPSHRHWICQRAVTVLEMPSADGSLDVQALKLWRGRLKQAEEDEGRAWEELTETPFFQSISRHDLNEFEKIELQAQLAPYKSVTQAWLVRKNLKVLAHRRCYILFLDLPGLDDGARYELCRHMEGALDLPGSMLVLWAGESPTLTEIQRQAFDPVYLRTMD